MSTWVEFLSSIYNHDNVNRKVALNVSYIGIDKDHTFDDNPPKKSCLLNKLGLATLVVAYIYNLL